MLYNILSNIFIVIDLSNLPSVNIYITSLYYNPMHLVTQMVKNLPSVQETWVSSLGREDPLEEEMATHSSLLAWRIPMDRGAWRGYSPRGRKESDTTEAT